MRVLINYLKVLLLDKLLCLMVKNIMDQIELNARQDLAAAYRLADYLVFQKG